MNTQLLIRDLFNPDPAHRLNAARIIGIVDEVDAIPSLTRAFKSERDEHVRSTIEWAGQRLRIAQANGYTTFAAIWDHFEIQRELDAIRNRQNPDGKHHLGLDAHQLDMLHKQTQLESNRDKLTGRLSSM
ncbi:MAG TPA: HEAT repeat domain-containing protein, partial [Phototrophicaceae bacterium]|nr:HEAT repeat domain-containing protein [Phototrophicaceae bacterium]